jgi:hypothetical protein
MGSVVKSLSRSRSPGSRPQNVGKHDGLNHEQRTLLRNESRENTKGLSLLRNLLKQKYDVSRAPRFTVSVFYLLELARQSSPCCLTISPRNKRISYEFSE